MNLNTIITAAATLGQRPDESNSTYLILMAFIAVLVVIGTAAYLSWDGDGDWWWPIGVIALLVILGIVTWTGSLIDEGASDSERKVAAWNSETAAWAKDVYGVTAGADEFYEERAYQCPTHSDCYRGKVLIGKRLTEVTMVTISGHTLLLAGDGESGKELRQVAR